MHALWSMGRWLSSQSPNRTLEKRMNLSLLLARMHRVNICSSLQSRALSRWLFIALVAAFGLSTTAFAQQATVVGTVTDTAGAALPNVNITITNVESGAAKSIESNSAGQYVVPDLNIGHYNVKAEAKGFKTSEQKNIALEVGDRDRIDFQLQVGEVQET